VYSPKLDQWSIANAVIDQLIGTEMSACVNRSQEFLDHETGNQLSKSTVEIEINCRNQLMKSTDEIN